MVITRTPFRMSFFGGGTDMEDYFKQNGGSSRDCYLRVKNA